MNKEQEIREAIISDIMTNLSDDDLGIIRDALEAYYELATVAELEAEYKERAFS